MKNVLMHVCRTTHRLSKRRIASQLGITSKYYTELETGLAVMTPDQAEGLSHLYNVDAKYFLESSLQLELLLTRGEVIKILQSENQRLNQLMEGGYEVIHNSKTGNGTEANENACYEQTPHQ